MTTGENGGSGLGKLIAAALGIWVGVKAMEGITGRSVGQLLDEVAAGLAARERQRLEEERRQRLLQELNEVFRRRLDQTPLTFLPLPSSRQTEALTPGESPAGPSVLAPAATPPATPVPPEPDAAWRQRIVHPSVVLIVGKRGSGKSALGYRLLELFRYIASPYVVGVPASARSLLPDWIGIAPTLEEVPRNAMALVDEAYLAYHARGSMLRESRAMSQALNLSRQRDQSIIFVSQEARQVDRNIASSANVIVFKDLGILQLAFDRPELTKLAMQAREALASAHGDRRRWAYVYAPDSDYQGLLENRLPSFWKPSLSRLFSFEATPARARAAQPLSPQEKATKARAMRAQGLSYREIAQALGVTRATVVNYLKGYPYRPR